MSLVEVLATTLFLTASGASDLHAGSHSQTHYNNAIVSLLSTVVQNRVC